MVAPINVPLNRCACEKGVLSLDGRWVRLIRNVVTVKKTKIYCSMMKVELLDFRITGFNFTAALTLKLRSY
jgi:hypothetical protein